MFVLKKRKNQYIVIIWSKMDVMKEISVGIIEKWKGKYHTKSKDDQ